MMETRTTYRDVAAGEWQEKVTWGYENLYPGGHYEPKWYTNYPFIVFEDEKEYAWFLLRWS